MDLVQRLCLGFLGRGWQSKGEWFHKRNHAPGVGKKEERREGLAMEAPRDSSKQQGTRAEQLLRHGAGSFALVAGPEGLQYDSGEALSEGCDRAERRANLEEIVGHSDAASLFAGLAETLDDLLIAVFRAVPQEQLLAQFQGALSPRVVQEDGLQVLGGRQVHPLELQPRKLTTQLRRTGM